MNIHEYQAKALLKEYGIKVPNGYIVFNSDDFEKFGNRIETDKAVVKAQIHAGGRGKAGGVKLVDSLTDLIDEGTRMLGMTLVTHQTGPKGKVVNRVYLEEASTIIKEMYLSFVIDRSSGRIAIVSSRYGGMDIEETAEKDSDAVKTTSINPLVGIRDYQIKEVQQSLALDNDMFGELKKLLHGMYEMFLCKECEMVEINPLILDGGCNLVALDAKVAFTGNSLFRHPEISELQDRSEESEKELEANEKGLSYIALDGEIGCLVNGAGLAMATMDAIQLAGGTPANFLDVGGSASVEQVYEACKITLSDPNVKGLFVNIFGGIMQCDTVAKGIIKGLEVMESDFPVVVRLEGSNVEKGMDLLNNSNLNVSFARDMSDGANKIVKLIGGQN